MIKKFNTFNENKSENVLLYYAFDWDDNILNMPTVIHMDKLIDGEWISTDVSTSEFADVRNDKDNWRLVNDDPDRAFSEFRDSGERGPDAFIEDLRKAISLGSYGPAWDDFIECLVNGSLFAIITARGHEEGPMRKGVEWILDNILTSEQSYTMYNNLMKFAYLFRQEGNFDRMIKDKPSKNELVKLYLNNCSYVGVSSPSRGGSPGNPEKAKEEVLMEFKSRVNNFAQKIGFKAKVGFSDDDLGNVRHIEDLVDNLNHEEFQNIIQYVVKGTKNPSDITKKVRNVHNESTTPGLESSILPFTSFNNMTNRLYPKGVENRQDDLSNKRRREIEYLSKNKLIKRNKKK